MPMTRLTMVYFKKLHHYGIHGIVSEWIGSNLNNREQHVLNGDTISNNTNIDCGIPHGSILGHKLFIPRRTSTVTFCALY